MCVCVSVGWNVAELLNDFILLVALFFVHAVALQLNCDLALARIAAGKPAGETEGEQDTSVHTIMLVTQVGLASFLSPWATLVTVLCCPSHPPSHLVRASNPLGLNPATQLFLTLADYISLGRTSMDVVRVGKTTVHVCACVCMCVHVCACVCMCVHVCACVCVCVHAASSLCANL